MGEVPRQPSRASEGIRPYEAYLGRLYRTLLYAFEQFIRHGGNVVVELGTTRSFVPAGVPGCMVNDPALWMPNDPARWPDPACPVGRVTVYVPEIRLPARNSGESFCC